MVAARAQESRVVHLQLLTTPSRKLEQVQGTARGYVCLGRFRVDGRLLFLNQREHWLIQRPFRFGLSAGVFVHSFLVLWERGLLVLCLFGSWMFYLESHEFVFISRWFTF